MGDVARWEVGVKEIYHPDVMTGIAAVVAGLWGARKLQQLAMDAALGALWSSHTRTIDE